eukprot:gene26558-biopygen16853
MMALAAGVEYALSRLSHGGREVCPMKRSGDGKN